MPDAGPSFIISENGEEQESNKKKENINVAGDDNQSAVFSSNNSALKDVRLFENGFCKWFFCF